MLGVDPDAVAGRRRAGGRPTRSARSSSAPVTDLVEHLLRSSDNVLAEVLAREVALARGGEPSFAGARRAGAGRARPGRLRPAGAELSTAAGCPPQDRVPARLLGAVLAAAAAPGARTARTTSRCARCSAGCRWPAATARWTTGSARPAPSAPGRGVVRAKTGTLTGVSSLAGVVTDADGRLLVFALMSNGAEPGDSRPRLDAMAPS